jgi:hypothetical protein
MAAGVVAFLAAWGLLLPAAAASAPAGRLAMAGMAPWLRLPLLLVATSAILATAMVRLLLTGQAETR